MAEITAKQWQEELDKIENEVAQIEASGLTRDEIMETLHIGRRIAKRLIDTLVKSGEMIVRQREARDIAGRRCKILIYCLREK